MFDDLPPEITAHIFSSLSNRDLARVRGVSRRTQAIAEATGPLLHRLGRQAEDLQARLRAAEGEVLGYVAVTGPVIATTDHPQRLNYVAMGDTILADLKQLKQECEDLKKGFGSLAGRNGDPRLVALGGRVDAMAKEIPALLQLAQTRYNAVGVATDLLPFLA